VKITPEQIAVICHEACRQLDRALRDDLREPWSKTTWWMRQTCIASVMFHIQNPDAAQDAAHEDWRKHKFELGWKAGPIPNEAIMEHPCLVPFAELPEEQRIEHALFKAVVNALTKENPHV
jgi:hypothetical protein